MRKLKLSLLFLAGLYVSVYGQNESATSHIIKANSVSLNLIGPPALPIGITYGQMVTNRLSFEMGAGILSAGARLDAYLTNPRLHRFNVYTGLSVATTYEADPMVYVPVGVTYFGKKSFQYSLDGGVLWSEVVGMSVDQNISPWFGLKVGYRFGEDIEVVKEAEKASVKNIISLQVGWYDVMLGVVYERLVTPFWGIEAGMGFLGVSAGSKFYFPAISQGRMSFHAGLSESWGFDFWNGSSGIKTYIPLGVNLLTKNNFRYSLDAGPQIWHQENNDVLLSLSLRIGKAF
jgi:hypothetical protein